MEKSFWENRWNTNQIGFHGKINNFLKKYFSELKLKPGSRVLLPLCGKTLDIHWLLSQGFHVIGVEFVETAIVQLFDELGVTPEISVEGKLKHYSAPHIDIFVGDFFDVTEAYTGRLDAVYDRAAIVALPADVRVNYARHVRKLSHNASQLLITFEYDQSLFAGPPMSVPAAEVESHYAETYNIKFCDKEEFAGGIRGQYPATETAWLLTAK